MNPVFSNIVDLVGGLIAQEKKKKKKLKVISSKYPSSEISALLSTIKPRVRARPVLPAMLVPIVPARRGRPKGALGKKGLLLLEDARLAKAERDDLVRSEREAVREEREFRGSEAVKKRTERKAKKELETRPKARAKAKAPAEEKEEEEKAPETIFPALRAPTRDFTPGKESGRKADGSWSLSTTKGKEGAAAEARGDIPSPPRVSPMASAKRVSEKPPPATKPKLKVVPALKKKEAEALDRALYEGLAPVRAEAKAKAKKSSPREAIVEMPGFPAAIGSGLRRRRRVRMH
jgi:colicin import membrane protein